MLRVEKLHFEVKGRKLLKDISLQVRRGEVLALLGSNGAGKSTLMKLLCGEYKPSAGLVSLHGRLLAEYTANELATKRAMLSQQQQISVSFTVAEIVIMGRYPHFKSLPRKVDLEIVAEVMELCGVKDLADRIFMSLSGGEQQRVQLARVLAQVWDSTDGLLLLDEPISALDMHYQQKVLAIAKALSRKGFMVVIVVHEVNFAATYADRIVMLKNGRKLFDGTPVEVLNTTDIYTIFSVKAGVVLNPRNLRPYIQLEEMKLDSCVFHSSLSSMTQQTSMIQERRGILLASNPYLDRAEQAALLQVSEVEIYTLEKGRATHYTADDMSGLLAEFETLGEVQYYTKNDFCTHKRYAKYTYQLVEDTGMCSTTSYPKVRVKPEIWQGSVLFNDEVERSIHFFDRYGRLLHGVYLTDRSNKAAFDRIQAYFLKHSTGRPVFEQGDGIRDFHLAAVANRAELQETSIDVLKRIFASYANKQQTIGIRVTSQGTEQGYIGAIAHLVDQGSRYFVKDETFELQINCRKLNEIARRMYVHQLDREQGVLDVVDSHGRAILQITGSMETLKRYCNENLMDNNII
ncbi:heme ABC transporter ATP-binding protein [Sphingobacterium suaedae]|uniref:Heme ABC transporter ATP-binding protein n=1 Tax=Sphingobacterium suaedae TaxID=1686402 RepID=A0ABW5KCZ8_9SPHI